MKRLSPLLWPGDKTNLGPRYLALLAPARGGRVLDPFCGSVGIHLYHDHPIVLGDLDKNLVNLIEQIKVHGPAFPRAFDRIADFADAKNKLTRATSPLTRAAAFLYLNRSSRFPHVKYNRAGKYVGVFYHLPKYPDAGVVALHHRMQTGTIRCADYRWVLREARKGDVVLLDPPYLECGAMYRGRHDKFDYEELLSVAQRLRARGVRAIISLNKSRESARLLRSADALHTLLRVGSGSFRGGRDPDHELVGVFDRRV